MNLQSVIDQYIEQDILDKHDLYSTDSMTPAQLDYEVHQYYKALLAIIKEKMDDG